MGGIRSLRLLAGSEVHRGHQLQAVGRLETVDEGEQRRDPVGLVWVPIELGLSLLDGTVCRIDGRQLWVKCTTDRSDGFISVFRRT